MPKTKLAKFKDTKKKKLSPAERSQVAKDRWAKIRSAKESKPDIIVSSPDPVVETYSGLVNGTSVVAIPYPPPAEQEAPAPSELEVSGLQVKVETDGGRTLATAPQLAPVASKKQKRANQPKEFSSALKAAEGRLAKAIVERAKLGKQLSDIQAEIPDLVRIIQALKGSGNYSPVAYDFSGGVANVPQYQPYVDPLEALNAAQPAPPISRASGGAVQFSPEMVGTLEGPEDDDPDRFIQGPNAGGGWIGG